MLLTTRKSKIIIEDIHMRITSVHLPIIHNVQGVVFSNVLIGETGKNRFINNNVDVTYLVQGEEITPMEIDLTCNYWKHGVVEGTPVIDIESDPEYDPDSELIVFETQPFLMQKGNSGQFTCTGGKGKNGRSIESEIVPMEVIAYHREFTQLMETVNGQADAYPELEAQINRTGRVIKLEDYTQRERLVVAHERALLKNGLFAYLYRSNRQAKLKYATTEALTVQARRPDIWFNGSCIYKHNIGQYFTDFNEEELNSFALGAMMHEIGHIWTSKGMDSLKSTDCQRHTAYCNGENKNLCLFQRSCYGQSTSGYDDYINNYITQPTFCEEHLQIFINRLLPNE